MRARGEKQEGDQDVHAAADSRHSLMPAGYDMPQLANAATALSKQLCAAPWPGTG